MVIYTDLLTLLFFINSSISTIIQTLLTIVDKLKTCEIVDKFAC